MIKTVLFDLDGTLLPMDQKEFTDAYFGALTKKLSAHGYDARVFSETMWKGVVAMMKNDGARTNAPSMSKRSRYKNRVYVAKLPIWRA